MYLRTVKQYNCLMVFHSPPFILNIFLDCLCCHSFRNYQKYNIIQRCRRAKSISKEMELWNDHKSLLNHVFFSDDDVIKK